MDWNSLVAVGLGAGGTGFIAAVWNVFDQRRKGKLATEETLIARLNGDSKQQGERADRAEKALSDAKSQFDADSGNLRRQRDLARDRAAMLRTMLISSGARDVPTLDDLYA
jgi:hypothetical protein